MPYCSMCMPIGWEGLSMPTDGCSVCMPIVIINSKLRGAEQDSVPYVSVSMYGWGFFKVLSPSQTIGMCIEW